jgi:hypothetical protein
VDAPCCCNEHLWYDTGGLGTCRHHCWLGSDGAITNVATSRGGRSLGVRRVGIRLTNIE